MPDGFTHQRRQGKSAGAQLNWLKSSDCSYWITVACTGTLTSKIIWH
jgi:hypothetical protein